jgi:hypothetical protein
VNRNAAAAQNKDHLALQPPNFAPSLELEAIAAGCNL